jgi:hypothetical protein
MTADDDHGAEHDDHADDASHSTAPGTAHDPDAHEGGDAPGRVTSPMQDYRFGNVVTGFLVLLVGVAVAYVLPFLF